MRIAMVGGYRGLPAGLPGSGGGENYQENLAVRLARRGHEVTAFNRRSYGGDASPGNLGGVRVRRVAALPHRSLSTLSHSFLAALDIVRHNVADIVQVHGMGSSLWLPVLRAGGKKTVVLLGGSVDWLRPGWGPIARGTLKAAARCAGRWADALYADNTSARDLLQARLGRPVAYIPTGAETWDAPGSDRLGELGVEAGRYVLHVSGLPFLKGAEVLVRAFEGVRTDHRLLVAGDVRTRPAQRAAVGADARVVLPGFVGGVVRRQLYSHAALYVQPSVAEGSSPSLLAAMGCGVCPVVSDIPANLEVVGEAGVAFRAGDAEDLRRKIQTLLDEPDRAATLGRQAAERARSVFDWDRIVDQFEAMCHELMAA